MSRTAIETSPTGTVFDFANLRPEMVHVEDIARALSHISRFGGHTSRPYSVAQHTLLVHRLVRDVAGSKLAFAALHHDSHEAYFADIPSPAAYRFGGLLGELKAELDKVIAARFDIDPALFHHDIVKAADERALSIEAAVLKVSGGRGDHWHFEPTSPADVPTGAVRPAEPQWDEGQFLAAHDAALAAMRVAA